MTDGMKTSEFWVGVLTAAVAFCNSAFGWGFTVEELLTVGAPAAAYILSRGLAKSNG